MGNGIDIRAEKLLPLRELPKAVGLSVTYETVLNWATKGRRNRQSGKLIKLETRRGPSGMLTTAEAYYRFIESLDE